jgi:hypothetical protein
MFRVSIRASIGSMLIFIPLFSTQYGLLSMELTTVLLRASLTSADMIMTFGNTQVRLLYQVSRAVLMQA